MTNKEYFGKIESINTYQTFYNCLKHSLEYLRSKISYNEVLVHFKNCLPEISEELLEIVGPDDRKFYSEKEEEAIYRTINNLLYPYIDEYCKSDQFKIFVKELFDDKFINEYYLMPLKSTDGRVLQWSDKYRKDVFESLLRTYITFYIYLSFDLTFHFVWKYVLNAYLLIENYMCKYQNNIIYRVPLDGFYMEADYLRLADGITLRRIQKWEMPYENTFDIYRVHGSFMIEFSSQIQLFDTGEYLISSEALKLDSIINILLLFKAGKFYHSGIHCLLSSFEFGFRMYNGGLFSRFSIPNRYPDYFISKSELRPLIDFFKEYSNIFNLNNQIDQRLITVISMAVKRLRTSMTEIEPTDKVIDLMIAAESLLSDDTQELSHKLALRTCFLIGEDISERKRIFTFVKKMYGIRSKAVHGDDLSNTKVTFNKKNLSIVEASLILEDIIRLSILKFLDLAQIYKRKNTIISLIDHMILGYIPEYFGENRRLSQHISIDSILKALS